MQEHNHAHITPEFDPVHPERYHAARKSTWVSVWVNVVLTIAQIVGGALTHSQALIADGLHSLSDLISDVMVLFANRHSHQHADAAHPYGHARIETATTLILGAFLAVLGVGLLVAAAMRLQTPSAVQTVSVFALAVAATTLLAKELLFRYLLAVAKKVRSQMLVANAWHARSDAASSLVVLIGLTGSVLGYGFLDLVAAAVVGGMIAHMGGKLVWESLSELIDTGLDEQAVSEIKQTLLSVDGVLALHALRTRKMADSAMVDAHIVVDGRLSVSEGHYIAEAAQLAVMKNHHVSDVIIHIDPQDDGQEQLVAHLPSRTDLQQQLLELLAAQQLKPARIVLHYLDNQIEAELYFFEQDIAGEQLNVVHDLCQVWLKQQILFRAISIYKRIAPI